MPQYDAPWTAVYNFPNMDFGAAAGTTVHSIAGPAGMQGRLVEVGVVTTEATVFATTLGMVYVGTFADTDKYAILNIATGVADNTVFNTKNDADAILIPTIPKDTALAVTLTEGTGAGLTGQGYPYVIINWFK